MRYRRYDLRLRNLVATTGDIKHFRGIGVPESTLRQWIKMGPVNFISLPEFEKDNSALLLEITTIKAKLLQTQAEQELLGKTLRVFGFQIQYQRLPSDREKSNLLEAVKKAVAVSSLENCLKIIGLSHARYHFWRKQAVKCQLNDRPSCPRVSPTKLLFTEVQKIRDLFLSPKFSHYGISSLCLYARRSGEIMASFSTWTRIIRELDLKRNIRRLYPAKAKTGIRASAPGQLWHLDQTILKLEDGTRAYVRAVVDNFSRYVLAWQVTSNYGGRQTRALLEQAVLKAQSLGLHLIPNVMVDSGCENINSEVDHLVATDVIRRTIAQIDIEFSNSMIESQFLRLKHQHLFRIPLNSFEALVTGVDFYFSEANIKIPQRVLMGATPEEVITGIWPGARLTEIADNNLKAREMRLQVNRAFRCSPCLA